MVPVVAGLFVGATVAAHALPRDAQVANESASARNLKVLGALITMGGSTMIFYPLERQENEGYFDLAWSYFTKTLVGAGLMGIGYLLIRVGTVWDKSNPRLTLRRAQSTGEDRDNIATLVAKFNTVAELDHAIRGNIGRYEINDRTHHSDYDRKLHAALVAKKRATFNL